MPDWQPLPGAPGIYYWIEEVNKDPEPEPTEPPQPSRLRRWWNFLWGVGEPFFPDEEEQKDEEIAALKSQVESLKSLVITPEEAGALLYFIAASEHAWLPVDEAKSRTPAARRAKAKLETIQSHIELTELLK